MAAPEEEAVLLDLEVGPVVVAAVHRVPAEPRLPAVVAPATRRAAPNGIAAPALARTSRTIR
jgi:hypothetical protein